jgi:hypothetical protein
MSDYGETELCKIESGEDFWNLIDELYNDGSGSEFVNNRNIIVEAYKDGNLYGLEVGETFSMYERGARRDTIFCKDSYYMLPCFCIKEDDTAILIWVHSRARMKGYGKRMIELLGIKKAYRPLSDSIEFWEKLNIELLK